MHSGPIKEGASCYIDMEGMENLCPRRVHTYHNWNQVAKICTLNAELCVCVCVCVCVYTHNTCMQDAALPLQNTNSIGKVKPIFDYIWVTAGAQSKSSIPDIDAEFISTE